MGLFRATPPKYAAKRSLVASAATVRLNNRTEMEELRNRQNSATAAWQHEAWDYYDAIGEVKYAFRLTSNITSRVRIYPAVVFDQEDVPLPVTEAAGVAGVGDFAPDGRMAGYDPIPPAMAQDAMRFMHQLTQAQGMAEILRVAALNLSVAGECYLACIAGRWSIRSTEELLVQPDGSVRLRQSLSETNPAMRNLPKDTPIGRIWCTHPRYSRDPDSSMKALRGDCEELLLLNRMIRSTARSRMNAGVLFVPDSMSVAARTLGDESVEQIEGADPFETELYAAMTEPVTDEASASTVVPLLIRGPAEQGQYIKFTSMAREADQYLVQRADKVLDRILQGIDAPKEMVAGLAAVKYSNAIVISESMYKAHIEPAALMISDALSAVYLRPLLAAAGHDPELVARVTVWYDPSEIVVRPDRGSDADTGYANHVLSADAWRDAHGFSDTDAPDPEETMRRLLIEKAPVSPELAGVLVRKVLPQVMETGTEDATDELLPPELREALSGSQTPESGPDGSDPDSDAAASEPATTAPSAPSPPSDPSQIPEERPPLTAVR